MPSLIGSDDDRDKSLELCRSVTRPCLLYSLVGGTASFYNWKPFLPPTPCPIYTSLLTGTGWVKEADADDRSFALLAPFEYRDEFDIKGEEKKEGV